MKRVNGIRTRISQFQQNALVKKCSECAFFIALIIEVVLVVIDKSAYTNPIEGRVFQITFLLFFLKLILTEYSLKEYCLIGLFCLFGLWIDQAADRNEILRFVVFIASCKNIDIKKALKVTLWLTVAGCVIIALLSITGVYGDLTVIKEYPGEYAGQITKKLYVFGMGNANAFHCMFFSLTLLGMYLYHDRMKWWGYVSIVVINSGLFLLTDSKTGLGITTISVFGMYLTRQLMKKERYAGLRKGFGTVCIIICILCVVASAWLASVSWKINHYRWSIWDFDRKKSSFLMKLDGMLTGRIRILTGTDNWDGAIQSWRWFPVKGHEAYFDLGFVRVFYWYGIIAAVLLLGIIVYVLVYFHHQERYPEMMMITLIAVYTIIEAHFVSVYLARDYVVYFIGACWGEMILHNRQIRDKRICG